MDIALQMQLAQKAMGGEAPSSGILGIPLLRDTNGILGGGETPNLAMLLRQVLCINPEGRNKFDIGNPNGWLARLIKSLGFNKLLDDFKQAFSGSGISGGESHSGPVSSGVSHVDGLDHSSHGSGISYD